ncbi:MAG: hypothetical protein GF307_11905 [candidate division Zixibacteria bacterium]|nr:hypothetical protein [candidate division Zixibacteria bacterium]
MATIRAITAGHINLQQPQDLVLPSEVLTPWLMQKDVTARTFIEGDLTPNS